MLVAGVLAHRPNGFFVFKEGYEYVLVLAVVSLVLAVLGPGRLSVDHAGDIEITGWAGGGIALGVAVAATAALLGVFWRPAPKSAEQEAR
jgi:putative oxidoreductase